MVGASGDACWTNPTINQPGSSRSAGLQKVGTCPSVQSPKVTKDKQEHSCLQDLLSPLGT